MPADLSDMDPAAAAAAEALAEPLYFDPLLLADVGWCTATARAIVTRGVGLHDKLTGQPVSRMEVARVQTADARADIALYSALDPAWKPARWLKSAAAGQPAAALSAREQQDIQDLNAAIRQETRP